MSAKRKRSPGQRKISDIFARKIENKNELATENTSLNVNTGDTSIESK